MHRPKGNAIESRRARRWLRVISLQAAGLLSVLGVGFGLAASGEGHDHGHDRSAEAIATHAHADGGGAEVWTQAPLRTTAVSEPRGGSGEVAEVQAAHTHAGESVTGAVTQPGVPEVPLTHESIGAAEPLMDDMTNDGMPVEAAPHEHAMEDTGPATENTHPKNHPQPSAEELACLSGLTAQAKELTARLVSYDAAVAEGYRLPAREGGTHHPNPAYHRDGAVLDLARPESAIYRTASDGSKALIGVLYHAPVGGGPTPCGNATWWHTHPTCVEPTTRTRLDAGPDGVCPAGTLFRAGRTEMLHLWFVPRRGLN